MTTRECLVATIHLAAEQQLCTVVAALLWYCLLSSCGSNSHNLLLNARTYLGRYVERVGAYGRIDHYDAIEDEKTDRSMVWLG